MTIRRSAIPGTLAAAAALLAGAGPRPAWPAGTAADESVMRAGTAAADDAASAPDPSAFFQQVVERYGSLESYQDAAEAVYLTDRPGEEQRRVETRIGCEIRDGALRLETTGSQIRDALGIDLPVGKTPAMEALVLRYKLWLAPHMALRFTDDPRRDFRHGVEEGFTPTRLEPATIGQRQLMHLELRSGDGLSEECTAQFDLYVNPATMLVERIEGEQRLPDGAQFRVHLEITPVRAEDAAPAQPAA